MKTYFQKKITKFFHVNLLLMFTIIYNSQLKFSIYNSKIIANTYLKTFVKKFLMFRGEDTKLQPTSYGEDVEKVVSEVELLMALIYNYYYNYYSYFFKSKMGV